jgi:hypothetical protein
MTDEIIENDIKICQLWNRLAGLGEAPNKRIVKINIMRPKQSLPGSSLNFDHSSIMEKMHGDSLAQLVRLAEKAGIR